MLRDIQNMKTRILLPIAALLVLAMAGCSTIQSRINENPTAFQRLTPKQQQLVSTGRVSEGMSKNAVYIAWGNPDRITYGSKHGIPDEKWLYFGYDFAQVPSYSFFPVYAGGFVYSDYIYSPQYVSMPYVDKGVLFEKDRVVNWMMSQRALR